MAFLTSSQIGRLEMTGRPRGCFWRRSPQPGLSCKIQGRRTKNQIVHKDV